MSSGGTFIQLFLLILAVAFVIFIIKFIQNKKQKSVSGQTNMSSQKNVPDKKQSGLQEQSEKKYTEKEIICTSCNYSNPAGNNFCEQCGHKLS